MSSKLKLIRRGTVGSLTTAGDFCVHKFGAGKILAQSWVNLLNEKKTFPNLSLTAKFDSGMLTPDIDVSRGGQIETATEDQIPVLQPLRTIQERGRLETTVHSGIPAVDALAPIGRGGSMLFVTSRDTNVDKLVNIVKKGCASDTSGKIDRVIGQDTVKYGNLQNFFVDIAMAEKYAKNEHVMCCLDMNVMADAWNESLELLENPDLLNDPTSLMVEKSNKIGKSEVEEPVYAPSTTDSASRLEDSSSEMIRDPTDPHPAGSLSGSHLSNSDIDQQIAEELKLSSEAKMNEPIVPADQSMGSQSSPELRRFFAQITERAFNPRPPQKGSLTLLLFVNRNRHSLHTVRELQSLSDGHVWLGFDPEKSPTTPGITKPNCVDYRKSCTRFGLGTTFNKSFLKRHKTLHSVCARLRVDLATVLMTTKEVEKMSKGSISSMHEADQKLARLMKQVEIVLENSNESGEPVAIEEEVLLLLAASSFEFVDAETTLGGEGKFLNFIRENNPALLSKIRHEGAIESDIIGLGREILINMKLFSELWKANGV